MTRALALYDEALDAHGRTQTTPQMLARRPDGSVRSLPLELWLQSADAVDERVLRAACGPVLDIGCGPGRHLSALARRGIDGLGIDPSPAAVALARRSGARAILGSVFDEMPLAGTWRTILLLDGNIGIGGNPVRLLRRALTLLAPTGEVIAELAPPGTGTLRTLLRLESASTVSDWFDWAEVDPDGLEDLAAACGAAIGPRWIDGGRRFVRLSHATPG